MANIIECPICDSRFDVSALPDGSKIKCSKCKKVVGKLAGGSLMPILESVKKAPVKQGRPAMYSDENGEYEEVVVRRRVGAQGDDYYPPTKDRQDILLAVAGIVGIFAVLTLIYTIIRSQQMVIRAPMPMAAYSPAAPNTLVPSAPAAAATVVPETPKPIAPAAVNPVTPTPPVAPVVPPPTPPAPVAPVTPEQPKSETSPAPK